VNANELVRGFCPQRKEDDREKEYDRGETILHKHNLLGEPLAGLEMIVRFSRRRDVIKKGRATLVVKPLSSRLFLTRGTDGER
jgi:hypothetical protein